jgi:hypothetical protein
VVGIIEEPPNFSGKWVNINSHYGRSCRERILVNLPNFPQRSATRKNSEWIFFPNIILEFGWEFEVDPIEEVVKNIQL